MSTAPQAPQAPAATKKVGKNGAKALKTFTWSAKAEDENITFLKGKSVTGFPENLVEKYRELGLIEPKAVKKEED